MSYTSGKKKLRYHCTDYFSESTDLHATQFTYVNVIDLTPDENNNS